MVVQAPVVSLAQTFLGDVRFTYFLSARRIDPYEVFRKVLGLDRSREGRAARVLVERGHEKRYDYALQVMKDIPYGKWRADDPEDTVRFFALRLHETGLIQASPKKIIADGTDWRFLAELKKELKA
jgi:NitT/TauT family transport system substrate-binding protein